MTDPRLLFSGERTPLACCIRRLAECRLLKLAKASRLRQYASRVRSSDPRRKDLEPLVGVIKNFLNSCR